MIINTLRNLIVKASKVITYKHTDGIQISI